MKFAVNGSVIGVLCPYSTDKDVAKKTLRWLVNHPRQLSRICTIKVYAWPSFELVISLLSQGWPPNIK